MNFLIHCYNHGNINSMSSKFILVRYLEKGIETDIAVLKIELRG